MGRTGVDKHVRWSRLVIGLVVDCFVTAGREFLRGNPEGVLWERCVAVLRCCAVRCGTTRCGTVVVWCAQNAESWGTGSRSVNSTQPSRIVDFITFFRFYPCEIRTSVSLCRLDQQLPVLVLSFWFRPRSTVIVPDTLWSGLLAPRSPT